MEDKQSRRMSCTDMIESWGVNAGKTKDRLTAMKLNNMLWGAGLITKLRVEGGDRVIWVPTKEGRDLGIVLDEQPLANGNVLRILRYTPEASEAIRLRYLAKDYPEKLSGEKPLFVSNRKAEGWLDLFHEYLDERLKFLWDQWEAADNEGKLRMIDAYRKARVQEIDAKVDSEIYEDEFSASFYIACYSEFNAFEYSVLMQVVLENMRQLPTTIGMASIGCGSEMDLASALYRARYRANGKTKLDYQPVELARWPHRFSVWLAEHTDDGFLIPGVWGLSGIMPEGEKDGNGACDYFDKGVTDGECDRSVILFPKIMSELSDPKAADSLSSVARDLIEGIKKTEFTAPEVFVCISHLNEACFEQSRSSVVAGNAVLDAFADAMRDTHDMVTGDALHIPKYFAGTGDPHLRCTSGEKIKYPWFAFGSRREDRESEKEIQIRKVNRKFSWVDSGNNGDTIKKLVEEMREFESQARKGRAQSSKQLKWPRKRCFAVAENSDMNMGLAFQIVKFVKKK